MYKKGLISRIFLKTLARSKKKKIHNPTLKWVKYMKRHFSKEDTHMTNKHMKRCSKSVVIAAAAAQLLQSVVIQFSSVQSLSHV